MARGGKKRKSAAADNARQVALESMNMLPMLKKPVEAIGKEIKVPGSHWGSNCASQDKSKLFLCVVLDFTHMHRSSEDEPPHAAFQLNEMGVDGSGGSSKKFWMKYPMPFLEFYYATFPNELQNKPQTDYIAGAATQGVGSGATANQAMVVEDESADPIADVTASVHQYLTFLSKTKGTSGHMVHKFKCNIERCGGSVTMYGKSTGAFYKHVRRKAKRDCPHHKAVLEKLNELSCRQVDAKCSMRI
ncbi:hypothetical protein AB1Y20_013209 [Prymnesium parvum]|uniref:Uncharacterized protein n=1 Tax=Prymnesium parvum TaxID=97485 RepID=A0AB34IJY3_PRYPA